MIEKFISPQLLKNAEELGRLYAVAEPFPHIVLDNFFVPEYASYLTENFPTMEQMPNVFREPMSYKGQLSDINGKWPKFREIFENLQSEDFRNWVSNVTGIPDLQDDKILAGGGLHQSPSSGFLDIHVDSNFHPIDKNLHRRVNIIIYVNENWQEEWGGKLQLWTDVGKKPGQVVADVVPIFNRAVIFSTTRTSWHGVSPIICPPGFSRKSLALYYYTKDRPSAELYEDSSVIWMNKDSKVKRLLYPALNFGIKIMKPYAKYIRRNVFDAKK